MYNYQTEKSALFTDDGQRMFLQIRDQANALLKKAGAFRSQEAMSGAKCCGSSWTMIACLDRMVELGEIREITNGDCWGQHRVFVAVNHNA